MADDPKTWADLHEAKQARFYQLMGKCVSAWAFADEELFKIFCDCMGPYEQSAIVYYRIQSLATRMALTDEIVKSVLPRPPKKNGEHLNDPSLKSWKFVREEFTKLLGERSRIAHQQVHVMIAASAIDENGDVAEGADLTTAFEIYASIHERLRETGSVNMADYAKTGLTTADLEAHYASVRGVTDALRSFRKETLQKLPLGLPQRGLPTD